METLDVHFDMPVPASAVWPLIANFADIEAWWPKGGPVDIERVVVEGAGIGVVRHIHNVGFTDAVSERLDFLDADNLVWKLSIVCDRPAGLMAYQATGRLLPLDDQHCRMTYHAEFEVEEGRVDEARSFLLGAYDLMFQGLLAAAKEAA
jgi:hypothetical protein